MAAVGLVKVNGPITQMAGWGVYQSSLICGAEDDLSSTGLQGKEPSKGLSIAHSAKLCFQG